MLSINTPLKFAINTIPRYLKLLSEIGIESVKDFLMYFPRTHEDQSELKTISESEVNQIATIRGVIQNVTNILTKNRKFLTKGIFIDEDGTESEVVWFNQKHIKNLIPINKKIYLTGKITYNFGKFSIQNPTFERIMEEQIHTGRIIPIYKEHGKIGTKWIREKMSGVIHYIEFLEENIPEKILESEKLIARSEAVKQIHFPDSWEKLEKARERLAFEELYLIQKRTLQARRDWQTISKKEQKIIPMDINFLKLFFDILPFKLTEAQKISLYEILKDMEKEVPMQRLLEGDVGSGKTVVVLAAMLNVARGGYQSVIMAPTEVLARQHYATISTLLEKLKRHERYSEFQDKTIEHKPVSDLDYFTTFLQQKQINVGLLTGSVIGKQREEILLAMENGQVDIMVGTHALIQKNIKFYKLGFAVIDEQHKFGVKQRNTLKMHGPPHVLNMSATPIPRSLALTAYGDQDLSVIDEMPPGRQTIVTKVVAERERANVYKFIHDTIKKNRQAYVICPLINESDVLEVKSAIKEHEFLSQDIFPDLNIGLMHGKLSPGEKDYVMNQFKNQELDILVSTSVIEVGIDVPNSTIMIIEGAERFGLAQLHQFRGRVGRSNDQSYCFIFSGSKSQEVYTRLKYMELYSSGFHLAEIDIKIRGPGEVYGFRQSGIPDLKIASISDTKMITRVRKALEKF